MFRVLTEFRRLWLLVGLCTFHVEASSHWMVTENGLIQPRLESPFLLAQPFDLLAFLNQDTRWNNILNLHEDLSKRQSLLDKLWLELEKNTDINAILNDNEECIKAGPLNLLDWYISFLEDGKHKIQSKEFLLSNVDYGNTDIPDCKKISSLTFSMLAFDHLEGVVNRENLSASPELSLPEQISPLMTIDQFGHWLSGVLKKNSSSWLHYNMASLYWRVRGNAPKAVECSRRAVHYAPREYKDIALLSLGIVLHRSKMTDNAITVLNAAVDHDPQCPVNHFALANAYAVLGQYNNSLKHYEMCLKLNPTFELADKHKSAVLCHAFLTHKMQIVQESLVKLREELTRYTDREAHWLKSQAALLRTMSLTEDFDYRNVDKNFEKVSKLTGLSMKDLKKDGDKYSLIQYFMEGPMYNDEWLIEKGVHALDTAYNLQRLIRHVSQHLNIENAPTEDVELTEREILKEIGPTPTFPDMFPEVKVHSGSGPKVIETGNPVLSQITAKKATEARNQDEMWEYETGTVLYPPTLKINRNTQDFDKDPDWPPMKFCEEISSSFPNALVAIYQVFLPFENKGISVKSLLSEKIGVPASVEHELPWHPPACPHDKEAAAFTSKKTHKPQITNKLIVTSYLRDKLLEYASNGHMQDAEIGHRIYVAMQKQVAPSWLLLCLSSLYWRVRGNNANALHCLLPAARTAPARHKDIVLVSLASLYLEMGYFEESLAAAEEAFKLSLYEPATNFLLAELNMIKKHQNTHMFHLKQVIRVEPGFMGGLARTLLNGWSCLFKEVLDMQEIEFGEGDICTQVEPGMSMVCEKDGSNCHVTNIQCFNSRDRESSTLVRMLELKDDNIQGAVEDLNRDSLDHVVRNKPPERTDLVAHQRNFDAMMKTVAKSLRGCNSKGCSDVRAADLAPKEEECGQQQIQLGYWLHVLTLRQLTNDLDATLISDMVSTSPSQKKVPECRSPSGSAPDFFAERMSRVDTSGWEPTLSLMHQVAEIFHFYDYAALGAKIAKYLDTRSQSWQAQVVAGWWCGAGGRGACALRCLRAAAAARRAHAVRPLLALLHIQSKHQDAKDVAYLALYESPKNKIDATLVAMTHAYLGEFPGAMRMFRYALSLDAQLLPARAGLRAAACQALHPTSDYNL